MINPANTCLFIPPELKKFKLDLFTRIAEHIAKKGGNYVSGDIRLLDTQDKIPIIGCTPELKPFVDKWRANKRDFIYWDRGYARRVFATHLERGSDGGYYRWHLNCFQQQSIANVPSDRWDGLKMKVDPWQKEDGHIVIAASSTTYAKFHNVKDWIAETIRTLALNTRRQLVIRDKESKRTLQEDLKGAHALVSHGSIAAVEAVILGYPVFVDKSSACALVGRTDLTLIEKPVYPDRQAWLNTLAYNQFNEKELVDGTLWKMVS